MSDYDKKCEVCGTPVRLANCGGTTFYYESGYDALRTANEALARERDEHRRAHSDLRDRCAELETLLRSLNVQAIVNGQDGQDKVTARINAALAPSGGGTE